MAWCYRNFVEETKTSLWLYFELLLLLTFVFVGTFSLNSIFLWSRETQQSWSKIRNGSFYKSLISFEVV